jgi:hypothetical protein
MGGTVNSKESPQRQKAAAFNLDKVMEQLQQTQK